MIAILGIWLVFIGLIVIDANLGMAAILMLVGIALTTKGLRDEK